MQSPLCEGECFRATPGRAEGGIWFSKQGFQSQCGMFSQPCKHGKKVSSEPNVLGRTELNEFAQGPVNLLTLNIVALYPKHFSKFLFH